VGSTTSKAVLASPSGSGSWAGNELIVGLGMGSPVGTWIFYFLFFNRLTGVGKATVQVKATITRDLLAKVVAKTTSVKAFCLPWLRFV